MQINFAPVSAYKWKKSAKKITKILESTQPNWLKKIELHPSFIFLKIIIFPFMLLGKIISALFLSQAEEKVEAPDDTDIVEIAGQKYENPDRIAPKFLPKISQDIYEVDINILCAGDDIVESRATIKEIASTFSVYRMMGQNAFRLQKITGLLSDILQVKNREIHHAMMLSSSELAGLVHLPTNYVKTPYINWVSARAFEPPSNLPIIDPNLEDDIVPQTQLTPIGKTNFRGTNISFGIGPDDRRRHMYIIGKTGMGKSVLLENMIMDDIQKGRGVAVIDPHGDLAEGIIGLIPKNRTNQTIILIQVIEIGLSHLICLKI